MGFKGFQVVETKPNKRDKTKARSAEHEEQFSPTAAAYRAEPKPKTVSEVEKSKRLPGENPIDPRQVKADLKAARSLQKVYASQTTTVGGSSNAPASAAQSKPQQQKVEKVDLGAWGTVTKPANATPASVSVPTHTSASGWGSKGVSRGTGALSDLSNFAALPNAGPEMKEDKRYSGPPKAPTPSLPKTNANKNGNNKGGNSNNQQQQQPQHVAHTLVVGKKVAPKTEASASAAADEAVLDEIISDAANPLPISVAAIVLTADGKSKEIALAGSLDKMASKCEQYINGMPKSANAVANLPIRAGIFMNVSGKRFSDASTIYEPWMAESYFKALTVLVEGEEEVATAHPYHPLSANGQKDAARAAGDVTMKIIKANEKDSLYAPTTLIELAHVGAGAEGIRVQVKKVRVSFKSFAQGMLRAGEQLVAFRETLEEVLEKSALKGAAGAEITNKFANKFNMSVATLKKALDKATA